MPLPQEGPQQAFDTSEADITVFGGSAGGGKTFSLVRDAVLEVKHSGYGFVIFRRTSPQITNEGGLWDESLKWYPKIGGIGTRGNTTWRFPNGVKGTFRHLQHRDTVEDWQGSQIAYIGFDELPHFLEYQFFYMLSRNRSTSGVKPKIRATCNPSPGWVKRFLAPWVDKNHPNPAKSGEIRWFIRVDGVITWVDANYRDEDGNEAKSVTFIRSSIFDNKILMETDPGYLINLKSLPKVEQARLLHGDWDVFEGAFFDEWSDSRHTIVPPHTRDALPPRNWQYFGGLDWGYGKPFCFLLCASDEQGVVHVIDEIYKSGLENHEQANAVNECLSRWGLKSKDVLIAADPSMWTPKKIGELHRMDIEDYWSAGLQCAQAENSRRTGWSQVRTFLHTDRLKCWKGNASKLIELMPESQYNDTGDLEDLDTDSEDHAQDALRYALMTRPLPSDEYAKPGAPAERVGVVKPGSGVPWRTEEGEGSSSASSWSA